MTLIKTEPNTQIDSKIPGNDYGRADSLNSYSLNNTKNHPNLNSRQALTDIPTNKKSPKQKERELQKQKYVNFLLNTKSLDSISNSVHSNPTPNQQQDYNDLLEEPFIKKEPGASSISQNEGLVRTPDNKRHSNSKELTFKVSKKKKIDLTRNFKDITLAVNKPCDIEMNNNDSTESGKGNYQSKTTDGESEKEEAIVESPGEFTVPNDLLYNLQDESKLENQQLDEVYNSLEQIEEQDFYHDVASWTLAEWIGCGQTLLEEYMGFVGDLVQKRMELSIRFQTITNVINERATALNKQDEILDEKLNKIKNLGKEILDII